MSVRVLIIDEHQSARESLARRLRVFEGVEVVADTGDGEEGLRKIGDLHPDVVLLDVKMKRADGIDVCRRACSTDGVQVTVLTSYIDPMEGRLAVQAGVHGYLLKDIDTAKLASWIKQLSSNGSDASEGATAVKTPTHEMGGRRS